MTSQTNYLTLEECLKKIEHEHNLINHRINWLMVSQAILIAAYITVKSNFTKVLDHPESHNISLIIFAIIFSGITMTIVSCAGVFAAFKAIGIWRENCEPDKRAFATSSFTIHFFGDLPAATANFIMGSLWAIIIYVNWNTLNFSAMEIIIPISIVSIAFILWFLAARSIFYKDIKI